MRLPLMLGGPLPTPQRLQCGLRYATACALAALPAPTPANPRFATGFATTALMTAGMAAFTAARHLLVRRPAPPRPL